MSNLVMATPDLLPARLLRNQSQYRTTPAQRLGAGLILKPTERGGYTDRNFDSYVLVYVLRGTGVYIDPNGKDHAVVAGDAIQMSSGRPHGVRQTPNGQWAEAFLLIGAAMERSLVALGAIDPARPILHAGVDVAIAERFEETIASLAGFGDDRLPLAIASLHEIIARLHVADRRRGERSPHMSVVDEACRRISEHPNRKPDLDDLLAAHALSYERFRKIFRRQTGQSPNDYRIRRRIDASRAMLAQQRLSIKQVAYALGYPDPFTFSRQFKQVVGVSPRRFARIGPA